MIMALYSSKDFYQISNTLQYKPPSGALIQKQVLKSMLSQKEQSFSEKRQHSVRIIDLPSEILSMTIGELHQGESTRKHRHNYESLIYVFSGKGKSVIEDEEIHWEAGDAFYIPSWAWHRHCSLSEETCRYLACENAPMLQNLGLALKEEA